MGNTREWGVIRVRDGSIESDWMADWPKVMAAAKRLGFDPDKGYYPGRRKKYQRAVVGTPPEYQSFSFMTDKRGSLPIIYGLPPKDEMWASSDEMWLVRPR